jgi:hypothetical protein
MRSLDFIRGLVRPLVLVIIVSGVTGLAIYHGVTTDAKEATLMLAAFSGPIVGFWFNSRETAAPEEPTVVNNSIDSGLS